MEEWFKEVVQSAAECSARHVATNLTIAALFGFAIGGVYYLSQRRNRREVASFIATLVLLTVLLAMVTVVIGNNLARAFGLVGALSIVRFRTVVDDTRDTAFVIFAVVTGMAVGSDLVAPALVAFVVVSLAALLLSLWPGRARGEATATLVIKIAAGSLDPEAIVAETLAKHLQSFTLTAVGTGKQGAVVEFCYKAMLRPAFKPIALIMELNRTEGVSAVEWKS